MKGKEPGRLQRIAAVVILVSLQYSVCVVFVYLSFFLLFVRALARMYVFQLLKCYQSNSLRTHFLIRYIITFYKDDCFCNYSFQCLKIFFLYLFRSSKVNCIICELNVWQSHMCIFCVGSILDCRYHMDPSGTFLQFDAKAIGSGSEGAQSQLQEQYHKVSSIGQFHTEWFWAKNPIGINSRSMCFAITN